MAIRQLDLRRAFEGEQAAEEQLMNSLTAVQAAFNALLAKIDADASDTGGDSDYASTLALSEFS